MVIQPKSGVAHKVAVIDIMGPLGDIEPACAYLSINGNAVYIDQTQVEAILEMMEAACSS